MPFINFTFRLKPIVEVAPVFASAQMPQFIRALSNLFFQTLVFVHVQNRPRSLVSCFGFHIGPGIVDHLFCQLVVIRHDFAALTGTGG